MTIVNKMSAGVRGQKTPDICADIFLREKVHTDSAVALMATVNLWVLLC